MPVQARSSSAFAKVCRICAFFVTGAALISFANASSDRQHRTTCVVVRYSCTGTRRKVARLRPVPTCSMRRAEGGLFGKRLSICAMTYALRVRRATGAPRLKRRISSTRCRTSSCVFNIRLANKRRSTIRECRAPHAPTPLGSSSQLHPQVHCFTTIVPPNAGESDHRSVTSGRPIVELRFAEMPLFS